MRIRLPPDDPRLVSFGVSDYDDDPQPPKKLAEPATMPSDTLQALGPPPPGALAAAKWAHQLLIRQAYETMMSSLDETTRRKEVRAILRDAAKHMTDAARYDYMRLVEEDQAQLKNKQRGRANASAEPVGRPPAGATVIPIRRDG